MTFHEFNLHDDLLAGVDAMNYLQATPIQEQAIPKILDGKDLIACAQTGTGKTAAYLIPLLDRISHARHDHTSTLILVPTRELAKQIDEQVEGFSYFVQASSIAIYGGGKGEDWDTQRKALTTGADIIIATPGRLMAHMQLGYVNFAQLDYLVLDEADKMLDMGFSDDILNIVRQLPAQRQTLLFSATMPPKIRSFAQRILQNPEEISLAVSKPAEGIDQQFYLAYDRQKLPILEHLIKNSDVQSMVVFTSRKSEVNPLVRAINKLGYKAYGISSDLPQDQREVVLREFKSKQFPILVATDVLSRGIDIDNLTHVVNYDIPPDAEDYVHRIGRTARAASTGTAITFISDERQDRIQRIERLLEKTVEKRAITEELGLGTAPEFDPVKYRGMRGGGKGRDGRGGGGSRSGDSRGGERRGGDRRQGERRSGGGGQPRPEARQEARPPRPEGQASAGSPVAEAPREGQPNGEQRRKKRKFRKEKPQQPGAAPQPVGETQS